MGITEAIRALLGPRVTRVVDVRSVAASYANMSATDLYRNQPALRAVVSFIARSVAETPIKCYVRASDTDRQRDTTSDLALLLARPSPSVTTYELVIAVMTDYLLYEHALVVVLPNPKAPSGWTMRHMPWTWVTGYETANGFEPSVYKVTNPYTKGVARFDAEDCIHFHGYNPTGGLDGASPVEALKEVLAEQVSAWNFRNGVWKNGGRVTQYITRPLGAPDWTKNGGRDRFAKSWKERYSGEQGTNTGGTPLLEDGMDIKSTTFNAREAQWEEVTRLAREDVSAVYHVPPSMVWHSDGQTYASAKDNARRLYTETLAPDFRMIEQRLNSALVERLGLEHGINYCEFDVSSKLAASFEEQASVLQSSTGGPWMTRNEARARLNLPALDGADELIVPLNVIEGGLASANDTDPTIERYNAAEPQTKDAEAETPEEHQPSRTLKSRAEPAANAVDEITAILRHFAERQGRSVLAAIAAYQAKEYPEGEQPDPDSPEWWDEERWNRELADDLEPVFRDWSTTRALEALDDLEVPASTYDVSRTTKFLRSMAESRARAFNFVTFVALVAALAHEGGDGEGRTPEGVFRIAAGSRAERSGTSFATSVSAFGTTEAARQAYPRDTDGIHRYKVWVHHPSKNPRSNHQAMDGERVGLDDKFSNGADWPGDDVLGPKDVCYCHCTVEVEIEID